MHVLAVATALRLEHPAVGQQALLDLLEPHTLYRHPSIFLARGIYTRHKMIAYDVNPETHELVERWRWLNNEPGSPWFGEGYVFQPQAAAGGC